MLLVEVATVSMADWSRKLAQGRSARHFINYDESSNKLFTIPGAVLKQTIKQSFCLKLFTQLYNIVSLSVDNTGSLVSGHGESEYQSRGDGLRLRYPINMFMRFSDSWLFMCMV